MAIINTNGAYYKTIPDILKVFGIICKTYRKGYFPLPNGKRLLFFHLPKHHAQGGYDIINKTENWINIPDNKTWKAFTHIPINKSQADNSFETSFINDQTDKIEQAVFMRDPINGYQFYGIYKAVLGTQNTGICLYRRQSKTLNTAKWPL